MSRVEELTDRLSNAVDLRKGHTAAVSCSSDISGAMSAQDAAAESETSVASSSNSVKASAAMPPEMAFVKQHTADEVLKMMNRMPLFMTTLDETDGEGGENVELEALKALAYEGTRAEIAGNFREQGNEQARLKRWADAKQFYDKALAALRAPAKPQGEEEGPAEVELAGVDEAQEKQKEREIEEACLVNRALCNLESRNYRSCTLDCAAALRLNPLNVKAWYRSACACLALDKIPEAEDACTRGLEVDSENAALKALATKASARKARLSALARQRQEREARKAAEERALALALKARNIRARTTAAAPEMEDAAMSLASPLDPSSTLSLPVVLLYPAHLQSDFVKAFQESESLGQHLAYVFPLPWDRGGEYTPEGVECYMETAAGGLVKAGKKLPLLKILGAGKVEVVDGLVRVNVLPKAKAAAWVDEFKRKRPA